jgi:hypothetical protein
MELFFSWRILIAFFNLTLKSETVAAGSDEIWLRSMMISSSHSSNRLLGHSPFGIQLSTGRIRQLDLIILMRSSMEFDDFDDFGGAIVAFENGNFLEVRYALLNWRVVATA